jgi:zinc-ribbon domain
MENGVPVFCFECGFKLIESSKFCSSCGTPQFKTNQTFQVSLTIFSEAWIEEMSGADYDLNSAAETIQRSNDGWGSYLTFAEGTEQKLDESTFLGTNVDYEKVSEPEIGFGSNRIDFVSSSFQENMWEFVVRHEVEVRLQISSSSEIAVREFCQQTIKESFAIYGSASGEIVPIDELKIDEILDEAAVAEKEAEWARALAKGQS